MNEPPETEREKLRERIQKKGMNLALSHFMMAQCLTVPLIIVFGSNPLHKSFPERLIDATVMGLIAFGVLYGFRAYERNSYQEVAQELIPEATREDVPDLLGMVLILKGEIQSQAREKLLAFLPQLTEDDASFVKEAGRIRLQFLLPKRDREMVLLSLGALEKVGNTKSLPSVRALAEGKHMGETDLEVREAAQVCLLKIEDHLERIERGGQLLRPAPPNVEPETLLRPMSSAVQDEPKVLLRSGEKPED